MINLLTRQFVQNDMRIGAIYELNGETYLLVTEAYETEDALSEYAGKIGLNNLSNFMIFSYGIGLFSKRSFRGLLKLERMVRPDRLFFRGDKLKVQFSGDYTIKSFDLEFFLDSDDKFLLRDEENEFIGIYHDYNASFLLKPKFAPGLLEDNLVQFGTIKSQPTSSEQKSREPASSWPVP